jgi:RNA polymerase sigma factor (sigma-70 family)
MDNSMSDHDLIVGTVQKNIQHFETLIYRYSAYASKIVAMVGKSALNTQDIEEITADVFISIWNNAENINSQSDSIKSYLAAIARNKAKTFLRAKKIEVLPLDEDIIADQEQIEDYIDDKETAEFVDKTIKDLGEPDREIFIRRYFYFEKIAEISKMMSMNQKTVETRLLRGREKLKKSFLERGITV